MNIFFLGSVYGRPQFEGHYKTIINRIDDLGHTVNPNHVLKVTNDEMKTWSEAESVAYHKKIVDGIKQADAVFLEVSYSSTSIGYLMAIAIQAGKPVVAFYSGDSEPHLFRLLEHSGDKFEIIRYSSVDDLSKEVSYALDFVTGAQDTRFNFFISSELSSYLDWISKKKKIPRSVYLRSLIEEEMTTNDEKTVV
jgi:hypothetical protein